MKEGEDIRKVPCISPRGSVRRNNRPGVEGGETPHMKEVTPAPGDGGMERKQQHKRIKEKERGAAGLSASTRWKMFGKKKTAACRKLKVLGERSKCLLIME